MKRRNFLKSQHKNSHKKADRFKNPYFEKKTNRGTLLKKILVSLMSLAFTIGIIYLVLTLSIFKIKKIEVTGLITIQPAQIENATWEFLSGKRANILPQSHIWLTNDNKLKERLESQFQLKNVEITRYGRTLAINASERISRGIWVTNDKLYFIDSEGLIVRELTLDEMLDVQERVYSGIESTNFIQSDVFLIFDEKREVINISDQVLAPDVVNNLADLKEKITTLDIEPADYLIEKRMTSWLTLEIKHGFNIYINGAGDPEDQVRNLGVILDEYQGQLADVEYIDLRFDNRVYIK